MTAEQAVAAFTLAAGVLTVTPGLDTALVLRTAAVEGPRRAMSAGLGICLGCLIWGLAVSTGLGVLFAASTVLYDALRIVGACYLGWLGLHMLLRHAPDEGRGASARAAAPDGGASALRWLLRGLLTNLLNPKVGVFYVTFLPQFVPSGVSPRPFTLLLAAIHATEGLIWFAALVLATRSLGAWLRRPWVARWLDRATGLILVSFGLALVAERR